MLAVEILHHEHDCALWAERDGKSWSLRHHHYGGWTISEDTDDLAMAMLFNAFLGAGYDRFVLYLEDTILVSPSPSKIMCFNIITGTVANADWTSEQVQAVCALAIGGDKWPEPLLSQYYKIAEDTIAGWPKACRPIP